VGFNVQEGVGGIVNQNWAGTIQLSAIDLKPFPVESSLAVTRLGSVDVIFGLPWLDKQASFPSGSSQEGYQCTLGPTPLYVMETASMGGMQGGKEGFFFYSSKRISTVC
jgi:hypothetical protein